MSRWKLVFEEFACWGCRACEAACKQQHNPIPPEGSAQGVRDAVRYLSVWEDGPRELDGKLHTMWRVNVCRHCDDPVCAVACPADAIQRDPDTGIVLHDPERCDGCHPGNGKPSAGKGGVSPCKAGCPAENNVQGFVRLAAAGKYGEALQVLRETSPFPAVCGRVCDHPCESDCSRKEIDDPVSIRSVERFLADLEAKTSGLPAVRKIGGGRKVAVIGAGPAGLTAAYFLARDGYAVTVFEKLPIAGGMMAVGIPGYRLPREVLDREIRMIRALGVEIRTGVEVGKEITLEDLRKQGTEAFFLAIGTHECKRLGIEGEDLQEVYPGLDFLRDVNLGKEVRIGKRVAVIGGGNAAIDSVRTALRCGAKEAFLLYRRGLEEMPASLEEIQECRDEGIAIHTLTDPRRIVGEGGKVKAVECVRMKLGEPDASGRRRPIPIAKSEFLIEVDAVIPAVGQGSDWACLGPECGCTLSEWGTMKVNPLTLQTEDSDIFAGGDAVTGPATVAQAIGAGRRAAVSIDRHLRGLSLMEDRDRRPPTTPKPLVESFDPSPRAATQCIEPRLRVEGFEEVRCILEEGAAAQEAKRCLSCGTGCIQACPYEAVFFDDEAGKARKCNLCHERVKNGLYPACADNVCLAHCIYFGDPAEIERQILEKRKRRGGWGEVIPKAVVS
jgi:NADPH-dependent glutamate synthase beta subunit-like oxidoreductase